MEPLKSPESTSSANENNDQKLFSQIIENVYLCYSKYSYQISILILEKNQLLY